MNKLRGRLVRLERALLPAPGRCPRCPRIALVTVDADGNVVEGAYPKPCQCCGGPYDDRISYVEVCLPRGESPGDRDGR